MTDHVDERTISDFRRDGAVPLRGVFTDWVETLRRGVERNMNAPGPDGKTYVDEETGGRFLSDYCNWDRIAEYRDFIFNSGAAAIGAALMESHEARLFHEHVLVKTPKTGIATPWHQDMPYYPLDAEKTVSLWIPLDDIPRERTLEFVAGSHRWDKLFRPQRFNGQALNADDGLEEIPDIDADRGAYDILGWALAPGDAVAFDYRTVHGAPANDSASAQRRAFSLRLAGAGATFARRDGLVTSPPFRDVELAHGAPLSGPEFPTLIGA